MVNKYLTLNNKKVLGLGLGSYGFGEPALADQGVTEEDQVKQIKYALDKGVNYVVGYLTYANGKAAELLSRAAKESLNPLYITFCAYPSDYTKIEQLEEKFKSFLMTMNVKKVDTFMVSSQMEDRFGTEITQKFMKKVLDNGWADSLGINNFNLEQLNKYYSVFGKSIVLHELCHNFEIRIFEDLGIIKRGNELGIQPIVYQPLRRNRTALRNWPLLVSLSKKYNKTQNQIILNWLNQVGMLSLVKASNNDHVDENLESLNFEMDSKDIKLINDFRPNWEIPKLNWDNFNSEDGLYVAKLSNVFDEEYDKQSLKG